MSETCGRCRDKATVTLVDERLCQPCAAAVIEDRAFNKAWRIEGVPFQTAYDLGKRAKAEWLYATLD